MLRRLAIVACGVGNSLHGSVPKLGGLVCIDLAYAVRLIYRACTDTEGLLVSSLICKSLHFNGHFPGEPGLAGVY